MEFLNYKKKFFYLFGQRYFVSGLTDGAVKGE